MPRLISLILLIAVLTLIQSSGFSIFGVKPNLSLVAVIAVSFFIADAWEGFLLAAIAAFLLKFSPAVARELIVFMVISVGAVLAKNYLPWRRFLNSLILISLATFVFFAFTASQFLYSAIFWKELLLNLVFGSLVFAFLLFCGKIMKSSA